MLFSMWNYRSITVVLTLQVAVLVLLCYWYMEIYPFGPVPPSNNGRRHILLLSTHRSGSSFMGEVFSQHPDVFYLMEPAYHVWIGQSVSARRLRMGVRDLLRSIFQCDFSVMDSYMNSHPKVYSLFSWWRSRALCSPPACTLTPRSEFFNDQDCTKVCGNVDLHLAQDACGSYSHVALKTVRVLELESLYPLLRDPSLDLRIVHLVRDPRAVLLSRQGVSAAIKGDGRIILEHRDFPESEIHYEVMKQICLSQVNIIGKAFLNPPPFLKGRYKLVRFEDVASRPLEEVNLLYDFTGLKMTAKLQEWIYHTTHGKIKERYAFSVSSRNASDVAWAWRLKLPHKDVKRIQEVCEGAMKLLGYRAVHSEEEQKDPNMDMLMPQNSIMETLRKREEYSTKMTK